MIESNLIVRSSGSLNETGPGPDIIVGQNESAGFYGEVPTVDLIDGPGLASLIGLSAGTTRNDTSPWLKFFIDDKIVFIAKKSYRDGISWDNINAVNAVDGSRIVTIKGYKFKVSLPKGLNPDTSVPFTTGIDVSSGYDSEWNRLMYYVAIDNPSYPKTSQVGPNWANYPQNNSADGLNISAGNGRYSWCQETPPGQPTMRVYRGYYAVSYLNYYTSSVSPATSGWRPRLELITS